MSQPGQCEHVGRDGVGWDESSEAKNKGHGVRQKNSLEHTECPSKTQTWIWVMVMLWSSHCHRHLMVVSWSSLYHYDYRSFPAHGRLKVTQLLTWSGNSIPDLGVGVQSLIQGGGSVPIQPLSEYFLSLGHRSLPAPQDSCGPLSHNRHALISCGNRKGSSSWSSMSS